MTKRLILMHGRSIKPAEAKMKSLALDALKIGLARAGNTNILKGLDDGDIKYSFVYYGDINNRIQAKHSKSDAKAMTAKDPKHNNGPALPWKSISDAMEYTNQNYPSFTLSAYKKVLANAKDSRLLDDLAGLASFLGNVITLGTLNELAIEIAKPDLAAYLMHHPVGSEIRSRLRAKIEPSMKKNEEIILVTHSMGCMVAYDLFWKFSHESEYAHLRDSNGLVKNPVKKWITIGSPLAEPGVRRNLRDGHKREEDKYPRNAFVDWINVRAKDDFIAHRAKMKGEFKRMLSNGYVKSIQDSSTYNCWVYEDVVTGDKVSNPHDLYGYLINKKVAGEL